MKRKRAPHNQSLDPLYTIFEHHLFHFHDPNMERKEFFERIIKDYFDYMRKHNLTIPYSMEEAVKEELSLTVRNMLTKKIYGCLTVDEYVNRVDAKQKKKSKTRYSKL